MLRKILNIGLLFLALAPSVAEAQRAVFLVRHAEKHSGDDPALTEEGHERARRLAHHLEDAGVTAIVTSPRRRARETAAPLAEARDIELEIVGREEIVALVELLRRKHADDVVLVVAHSDTIPTILSELGHAEKVVIAHQQYDDLFVIVPRADGPPLLLQLSY